MRFNRDLKSVIGVYFLVLVYIIFVGNKYVNAVLVVGLFGITIYLFSNLKNELQQEKEDSVSNLKNKLNRSQKENEDTYSRFLSLSKTLGSGLLMVNYEGTISFSNKDVENYFSVNFNNKDYKETIAIKPLYSFINQAYLLEEYRRQQVEIEDRFYDLTATPLFEGDMFAGSLILIHDITLLKTAEKFQKRFTADVSHELRTPLSAIKGFSEILLRNSNTTELEKKEFIDTIHKEAERMEIIINDLMVISRLDRIDYELDLQEYDISDIIKESVGLLSSKINEKNLDFESNVESCSLMMDKVKMSQVIINVLKNAINYTDEGFIKVSGKKLSKFYEIKIHDSGIGIASKNLDEIFKRFYRVDKARSRDTGGSGLGLSISKNVILKHGGTIKVDSEEGKGSTFTILLSTKK
jgi:two-component system phosphate regulon sensor histidine kinase PhoR